MTEQRNGTQETDEEPSDSEPLSTHSPGSYKVIGEVSETDATGVVGRNSASSGTSYGVYGETNSTNDIAAGVLGESPGSSSYGVMGLANVASPSIRSDAAGVYGEASESLAYGIFGKNSATSGAFAEAVFGITTAPDSPAITGKNTNTDGVGVKSDGDLDVNGNCTVSGHTDIDDVGVSAYLNSSVLDFGGGTVPYDTAKVDDRNEFDSSTGTVTLDTDGEYHVVGQVDFGGGWSDGDSVGLEIRVNGSVVAQSFKGIVATSYGPTFTVTKTLRNRSAGEEISVAVNPLNSTNSPTLTAGDELAYFTVSKIG